MYDPEKREKVWGYDDIGFLLGFHASTIKRYGRTDPIMRRILKHYRRRVFAYRDDLEYWRKVMTKSFAAEDQD